jgi:hypothetical protein
MYRIFILWFRPLGLTPKSTNSKRNTKIGGGQFAKFVYIIFVTLQYFTQWTFMLCHTQLVLPMYSPIIKVILIIFDRKLTEGGTNNSGWLAPIRISTRLVYYYCKASQATMCAYTCYFRPGKSNLKAKWNFYKFITFYTRRIFVQ